MKWLHWIIFSIAIWFILSPIIGDDILSFFLHGETLTQQQYINLTRWDDLLLGLSVVVLALLVVTKEQAHPKTPGLQAMHYLQVGLGLFVAISPFVFPVEYASYVWAHMVGGVMIAIFALLQIQLEND